MVRDFLRKDMVEVEHEIRDTFAYPHKYFVRSGFMWDIAPEFNALLVFAEHRYLTIIQQELGTRLLFSIH